MSCGRICGWTLAAATVLPWSVRCGVGEDRGWRGGGSATGYKCWSGNDLGWVQLPYIGVGQEMTWDGSSYRIGVGWERIRGGFCIV